MIIHNICAGAEVAAARDGGGEKESRRRHAQVRCIKLLTITLMIACRVPTYRVWTLYRCC